MMRFRLSTLKSLLLLFLIVNVSPARVPIATNPAEPASARPDRHGTPLVTVRIMPLGDSITELDWQGGYRGYLYKLLTDEGFDFDFVGTKTTNHDDNNLGFTFPEEYWDHEGYNSATITGTTGSTWIWNQNIETKLAANPPDVALVLLGTNDLNNGCCSAADILGDMSAFLDQIWAVDSNIIVILGTPPSVDSARYSALNNRITAYRSLLPTLVSEKKSLGRAIVMADHHSVMNATTDLVGDGIHPSPQGYRKMAQVWYDAIILTNVPPTVPAPVSPADGDTIPATLLASVEFIWKASSDPDPGDTLVYSLSILGPGVEYTANGLTDTTVNLDLIGVLGPGDLYVWTVSVRDKLVTVASPDTVAFLVEPVTAAGDEQGVLPVVYSLEQNYPNPFNPSTSIRYTLPEKTHVRLQVFNVLGEAVITLVDGEQEPGYRSVLWDPAAIAGGMYFYRLTAGPFTETRKMLLVR